MCYILFRYGFGVVSHRKKSYANYASCSSGCSLFTHTPQADFRHLLDAGCLQTITKIDINTQSSLEKVSQLGIDEGLASASAVRTSTLLLMRHLRRRLHGSCVQSAGAHASGISTVSCRLHFVHSHRTSSKFGSWQGWQLAQLHFSSKKKRFH